MTLHEGSYSTWIRGCAALVHRLLGALRPRLQVVMYIWSPAGYGGSYSSYSSWKRRPFDNRKPWADNCGIGLVFVVQECHDCSLYLILSTWWLILWHFLEGCNPIKADLEKAAGQDVRVLHPVLPSTVQSGPGNSFGGFSWPCHLCSSDHHHSDQVKHEQLSDKSYPLSRYPLNFYMTFRVTIMTALLKKRLKFLILLSLILIQVKRRHFKGSHPSRKVQFF